MTQEDLNQIRAIVREEIDGQLRSTAATLRREFAGNLAAAIADLRKELAQRTGDSNSLMQSLQRYLDRVADTVAGSEMELAALNRWGNWIDVENLNLWNAQDAHQRTVDDLAKRLRPPA